MRPRITDKTFYKYLKCPSWISHEMAADGHFRDPLLERLQDDGMLKGKELELLKDRAVEEVTLDDIDEATQKTIELMKQGVETIYRGVLIHEHWVAQPDILERVEGNSEFGDWYYVACDMKRSRHLKDEYKFQGSFYAEILSNIQGVKPVNGYILRADKSVESYSVEEFETQFHLTLDAIEDILDGNKEAHFLTSSCKQSPFFSECTQEALACEDLSVINRIWRKEMHALEDAGIGTIELLANASVDDLSKVQDITMDRLYFLQQQAISHADNKVIRMGEIDLPEEDGVALVVDIESDPLRDADYLFGVLLVKGDEQTYHAFLAKDPSEEERAWLDFIEFLKPYISANLYHYGWYEEEVFRRMGEKYGVPDDVKKMFEENMIDVLVRMREKVIFPMSFYSLKDVAKFMGFSWRHPEASGLNSVLWYDKWIVDGDKQALQDIVDYNEDDVRATWLVRNWAITESNGP
jgi:predicted RecB family nuclease